MFQDSVIVCLGLLKELFYFRSSSCAQNGMRESNGFPQVLEVAPLNSLPYVGPLNGNSSMSGNKANETSEKTGPPAMIFLPSESAPEFYSLISQSKTGVALTGSAAMGKIGPTIGLVDIAESDDSYYFRVSLPGVSRDESKSQNLLQKNTSDIYLFMRCFICNVQRSSAAK